MLRDIVIDTNVLAHASNPSVSEQAPSIALLEAMFTAKAKLAVDEGFDEDRDRNRSQIVREYHDQLVFGMLGYELLRHLAASDRILELPATVSQSTRHQVNRIHNPRDKTFLKVTCNTEDGIFVSHDGEHFPPAVRVRLRRHLGVVIVRASTARGKL